MAPRKTPPSKPARPSIAADSVLQVVTRSGPFPERLDHRRDVLDQLGQPRRQLGRQRVAEALHGDVLHVEGFRQLHAGRLGAGIDRAVLVGRRRDRGDLLLRGADDRANAGDVAAENLHRQADAARDVGDRGEAGDLALQKRRLVDWLMDVDPEHPERLRHARRAFARRSQRAIGPLHGGDKGLERNTKPCGLGTESLDGVRRDAEGLGNVLGLLGRPGHLLGEVS
jgi:hypothetical protein